MINSAKRVTIVDVAKESGVSFQTVSRVINNQPHVAPATRDRVLAAVSKLGYQPNNAARSLITNRTSTLGLLGFGVGLYAPAQIVDSIEREAKRQGYALVMSSMKAFTIDALEQGLREMVSLAVDGLILFVPLIELDMHRVEQACAGIPFVLVDIQPDSNVPSINIDQRKGAQLAAEYLIAQGHRNIAQIYGPLSGMDGKLRHDVFIASLKEHNIDVLANEEGNWSSSGGYKAMQTMLSSSRLPTAIFAHNDQMALGAIRAAKDANLQVPKDISFIGFDDIPEAAYFTPPLTTIKQDFTAVGQQSVEYLIALLGDVPPAIHQRIIIPELIERESVLKVV